MLSASWPFVAAAVSAATFAVALCGAAPAAVSVLLVTRVRSAAPLVRGILEQSGVLGSALVASAAALTWMLILGRAALGSRAAVLALSHPLVAVAPWMAGELLSGPSQRRLPALFAAVGLSGMSSWLLAGRDVGEELSLLHVIADALAVGLCAAGAYLAVRGRSTPAR